MDKMLIKHDLKQVKRDLEYYMKEYDMSQKEAYEYIHERYYSRMMLTKQYVELEERQKIYEKFKEGEKK